MAGISIRFSEDETNEIRARAISVLKKHAADSNAILTEDKSFSVLAFFEDRIVGGLIGKVFWNWLYADLVWVEGEFRGRGIGSEVMKAAEERAPDGIDWNLSLDRNVAGAVVLQKARV